MADSANCATDDFFTNPEPCSRGTQKKTRHGVSLRVVNQKEEQDTEICRLARTGCRQQDVQFICHNSFYNSPKNSISVYI